jgi:SAM-dependent methyltransferase
VLSSIAREIHSRKKGGRILDVGCATGYFLSRFFERLGWEALGVELSHYAASIAAKRGIPTHVGDLQSANLPAGSFDVVTVLDSFYYFREPRRELDEIRRLLRPDALLFLELPLASARIWRTTGRLGRLFSGARQPLLRTSDHLFYYDPKSIALVLRKGAFELKSIAPLPSNQPQGSVRKNLYRGYSVASSLIWRASCSRLALAPRFMVVAAPVQ